MGARRSSGGVRFARPRSKVREGPAQVSPKEEEDEEEVARPGDETFDQAHREALARAGGTFLQDRDADVLRSWDDVMMYNAENLIAQYSLAPFFALAALFVFLVFFFGTAWYLCLRYERTTSFRPYADGYIDDHAFDDDHAFMEELMEDYHGGGGGGRRHLFGRRRRRRRRRLFNEDNLEDVEFSMGYKSFHDAIWFSLQLMGAAGVDDSVPDIFFARAVYFLCLLSGLVVFAILVGFITDSVTSFMESLNEGRSKVVDRGHTLILGTNEATERLVTQISLLRRQHQVSNETWARTLLPWTRVRASTPLAKATVVVMTQAMTKAELNESLREALAAKGISPQRTAMGRDVICRVGDPTKVHDLMRVSADTATTIIVMMTDVDAAEFEESDGRIYNGATLKTLLALRHAILTSANDSPTRNIVVQLPRPAPHIETVSFCDDAGRRLMRTVDLSLMVNGLMFACASQQGLLGVYMRLLDADGATYRRRSAAEFCGGVVGVPLNEAAARLDGGCVIGIMPGRSTSDLVAEGYGICCSSSSSSSSSNKEEDLHSRPVAADDLIIFIDETSAPRRCPAKERAMAEYRKEAASLEPSIEAEEPERARHVFVCGWRAEWSVDEARVKARIEQISKKLPKGSSFVFFNEVPDDVFAHIMTNVCGFEPKRGPTFNNDDDPDVDFWLTPEGVLVERVEGDANDMPRLRDLIDSRPFFVGIVLSSQSRASGAPLSPQARDTRVLDILVVLRYLHERSRQREHHLHIVSENAVDETSVLALSPRDLAADAETREVPEPDFVNTQAIYARALVLVSAYPAIFPAIAELFDDNDGAFVKLMPAATFVPLHASLRWGVVQQRVLLGRIDKASSKTNYLAFGYFRGSKLTLIIKHDDHITFDSKDRICCFSRKHGSYVRKGEPTSRVFHSKKPIPSKKKNDAAADKTNTNTNTNTNTPTPKGASGDKRRIPSPRSLGHPRITTETLPPLVSPTRSGPLGGSPRGDAE